MLERSLQCLFKEPKQAFRIWKEKTNTDLILNSALLRDTLYAQRKRNQEECDQKGSREIWHYHRQDTNESGFDPIFIIFIGYLTMQSSLHICKARAKGWFTYQSPPVCTDWSKQADIQIKHIVVSFITPADTR